MSVAFIDFRKAFDNLNQKRMTHLLRIVAEGDGVEVENCVELIVSF